MKFEKKNWRTFQELPKNVLSLKPYYFKDFSRT